MHFKIQSNVFKYQSVDTKYPELKVENFSFQLRLLGFPDWESTRETGNLTGFEIPLVNGWKRELVVNGQTKVAHSVYYTSPCGAKFKSLAQLKPFCELNH